MNFTEKDLALIAEKGISLQAIEQQIAYFKKGFPFAQLVRPATIGDGILQLDEVALAEYSSYYEVKSVTQKAVKFVPASGAASRMFKTLFSFLEKYDGSSSAQAKFEADKSFGSVFTFITRLKEFAFYDELVAILSEKGYSMQTLLEQKDYGIILKTLLAEEGMDYGNLPKGLLSFHRYSNEIRTPIEEHIIEGANYSKAYDTTVSIHFTVSPEHIDKFVAKIEEVREKYEILLQCKLNISLSIQHPYTDTIAVDMENEPFRENDENLLFRPGGHGALLENVNNLEADIVFIKNIDNVVPDRIKQPTFEYKKSIGGILLEYQERVFSYLRQLERLNGASNTNLINEVRKFIKKELFTELPSSFDELAPERKIEILFQKLNRPVRVCGMVKNEGEPGGGPFWMLNSDGSNSLQIVESAQIDMENEEQKAVMKNSSHFNPVDVVCGLKNYKGEKFDLLQFRDPETGFIAYKSSGGRELKAQELPGLWNGAMSDWNTIFVEVPVITFNPVKIVNDLLRDTHK